MYKRAAGGAESVWDDAHSRRRKRRGRAPVAAAAGRLHWPFAMPLYTIERRGELHPFISYEFRLTSGAGAMASSSLVGCNTRRYHGLLCGATVPPVGRVMGLNRVGELIALDGRGDYHELSVNQFR